MLPVNTKELFNQLQHVLRAKRVPMVSGSPGIGKSSVFKQLADTYNLELLVYTLSNRDPTDIVGYPTLNEDRTRSTTAPPEFFPIEGDPLPEGKDGWLIFFDEIKDAAKLLQASVNGVILDRKVGSKNLHSKAFVAAAGNLDTDNGAAQPLTTTMQSRLIHYTLEVNYDIWLEWGIESGIDNRLLSFLKFRPELLYKFDPDHDDCTFPCPRTYEMLSDIIKPIDKLGIDLLPTLVGTVGKGAGYEFKSFVEILNSLPNYDELINNPTTVPLPNDPQALYAIVGLLAHHASSDNLEKMMLLITRLPKEFEYVCMKDICRKNKGELISHEAIQPWIAENANLMEGQYGY